MHDMMMPAREALTKEKSIFTEVGEARYESCAVQGVWDA